LQKYSTFSAGFGCDDDGDDDDDYGGGGNSDCVDDDDNGAALDLSLVTVMRFRILDFEYVAIASLHMSSLKSLNVNDLTAAFPCAIRS
jgi:hypothetical protein